MTRILLIEDHRVAGFSMHNVEIISAADNYEAALISVENTSFDIAIIDIQDAGLKVALELRRRKPDVGIIFISSDKTIKDEVEQAFNDLGLHGLAYVLKGSTQPITEVIERVKCGEFYIDENVMAGKSRSIEEFIKTLAPDEYEWVVNASTLFDSLSARELEVAQLAAEGNPSKLIAQRLNVSVKTIDGHKSRIYKRLFQGGPAYLNTGVLLTKAYTLYTLRK